MSYVTLSGVELRTMNRLPPWGCVHRPFINTFKCGYFPLTRQPGVVFRHLYPQQLFSKKLLEIKFIASQLP